MPPPLCFCRTVRRDTRKTNFPNKPPHGSSRAREQTTETPSTEAIPEHHRGCFNARPPYPSSPTHHTVVPHSNAVPPPNRLTAPRCGIHGGARGGRTFDYGPARRKSVSPTVTPPWIPVSTGKTKEVVVVPHSNAVPPPNRLTAPRCGIHGGARGGRTFDYGPAQRKSVLSTVTPPWILATAGKTRGRPPCISAPTHHTVVPHSDAVPMVE